MRKKGLLKIVSYVAVLGMLVFPINAQVAVSSRTLFSQDKGLYWSECRDSPSGYHSWKKTKYKEYVNVGTSDNIQIVAYDIWECTYCNERIRVHENEKP